MRHKVCRHLYIQDEYGLVKYLTGLNLPPKSSFERSYDVIRAAFNLKFRRDDTVIGFHLNPDTGRSEWVEVEVPVNSSFSETARFRFPINLDTLRDWIAETDWFINGIKWEQTGGNKSAMEYGGFFTHFDRGYANPVWSGSVDYVKTEPFPEEDKHSQFVESGVVSVSDITEDGSNLTKDAKDALTSWGDKFDTVEQAADTWFGHIPIRRKRIIFAIVRLAEAIVDEGNWADTIVVDDITDEDAYRAMLNRFGVAVDDL